MATNEPAKREGCAKRALGCLGLGAAGLFIFLMGMSALQMLFGGEKKSAARVEPVPSQAVRAPEVTSKPEQAEPAPRATPKKPSCVLGVPGDPGKVPVLPTEAGYDEFMKAAVQQLDERSMLTVLVSNGGFLVDRGTPCLAVDTGFVSSRVRVLEGPHAGKAGWVPNEWRSGG